MSKPSGPYAGLFTAGNNHFHGVQSVNEHGALAHAERLARVLLREGKVASEEEALSLANFEVQRLRWNTEGFQGNRIARYELQEERKRKEEEARQLARQRPKPV